MASLAAGCPEQGSDEPVGEIVVGIAAEEGDALSSIVSRVHVIVRDGASIADDRHFALSELPAELPVRTRIGAILSVEVTGFSPSPTADEAVWTRLARATVESPERRLLRIPIDTLCLEVGFSQPRCQAPQTCLRGRCGDSTLLAQDLEPYVANWGTDAPDACRPANAGEPSLELGTGQTDYMPLRAEEELPVERGPQGGHHIWVGVRTKNMAQRRFTVTLTGVEPIAMLDVPPTSFVFSLESDEGGYCKLRGLRFQLDNGDVEYTRFLGKPFDLTAEVRDARGTVLRATRRVRLAQTITGIEGSP